VLPVVRVAGAEFGIAGEMRRLPAYFDNPALQKGFFLIPSTSPPLWKFQLSFIHFFKCFGLPESPAPKEIPIPSVGELYNVLLRDHLLQ